MLKPSAMPDQTIEITRYQMMTEPPAFSPAHPLYEKMARNDAILAHAFGPRPLALAAYRCKFKKYDIRFFDDNHFDDPVEMVSIPLDDLTEANAACIAKVIIAPNVVVVITPDRTLPLSAQRLISREPIASLN
jgi:hypothetical protein